MATNLDLQEQEQLDALKAFWQRYGNLIVGVLIVAFGSYAGWNGWHWYQRDQSTKAAAMFDELERAAQASDAARVARVFDDLRQRYPSTAYAGKGGLLAARVQFDQQQREAGRAALQWVADHAAEDAYRAIARLRLAGVWLDDGKPDEALRLLDTVKDAAFAALVADRRGDALMALGRRDEARAAYQAAWRAMDANVEYRQLVEAKLTALGAAPAADGAVR